MCSSMLASGSESTFTGPAFPRLLDVDPGPLDVDQDAEFPIPCFAPEVGLLPADPVAS